MPLPLWLVELIKRAFPYRFLAAKLTKVPLLGRIFDHILFEKDNIIYVPQDEVIQLNMPIERIEEMVLPSSVVEHFIHKAKYHWIMNWCICRASEKCKDYPIDLGCLFLGEASTKIDSRLGRPVTKEEALKHIKRCQKAGLVNLIGRNNLDAVWLAVSPGYKLLTICNCCPCCCLWRILPHLAPNIRARITKMPGVEVIVTDRCIGCGTCMQGVCFIEAIQLVDNHAVIGEECLGCGRCINVCPQKAIEIKIDRKQYPISIERISSSVDVS